MNEWVYPFQTILLFPPVYVSNATLFAIERLANITKHHSLLMEVFIVTIVFIIINIIVILTSSQLPSTSLPPSSSLLWLYNFKMYKNCVHATYNWLEKHVLRRCWVLVKNINGSYHRTDEMVYAAYYLVISWHNSLLSHEPLSLDAALLMFLYFRLSAYQPHTSRAINSLSYISGHKKDRCSIAYASTR